MWKAARISPHYLALGLILLAIGYCHPLSASDEYTNVSHDRSKRANLGLRMMCMLHPRNCPTRFRKRTVFDVSEVEPDNKGWPSDGLQVSDFLRQWRQSVLDKVSTLHRTDMGVQIQQLNIERPQARNLVEMGPLDVS